MAKRVSGRRSQVIDNNERNAEAERMAADAAAIKLAVEQERATSGDSRSGNVAANVQSQPDLVIDRVQQIAAASATQLNNQPDALFSSGPTPDRQLSEVAGVKTINQSPALAVQPKTQSKILLYVAIAVGAVFLIKAIK